MKHRILLALALTGCGVAPYVGPERMTDAPSPRSVVQVHFKDRATLDHLSQRGVDLFENVDAARGTVGATLTPETQLVLKDLAVDFDVMVPTLAEAGLPDGYLTLDQLAADLKAIAAAHPTIARAVELGKSLEGRPILALEITSKPGQGLPAVRIGAGQHARELPPVELANRFMHQLVDGYGKDAKLTALVDTRDTWIVPVVNPDGRAKVEAGKSMWRKNTRQLAQGAQGVDTNRNCDSHWASGNSSPFSEAYRGTAPFSEPESRAMRDLCSKQRFKVSLDMHNFGGMVLWPPGHTATPSKDEPAFKAIGSKLADHLGYKAGTIATTIYVTDGDLASWEYEKFGTLAFAAELDDGAFGPAHERVEKDWQAWSPNLVALVEAAKPAP
ncbi:MAG: putative carboxypeptidase [Cyanobacteria bacterium RYN_339]|nr:putative carboxypeptidase [Cyanobacteria bacterium RYN_339]